MKTQRVQPNPPTLPFFLSSLSTLLLRKLNKTNPIEETKRDQSSFQLKMACDDKTEWRKNADTHKMRPEDIKAAGVEPSKRPPGHHPGEVLHQRRNLPFSPVYLALSGLLVVGGIGYLTLYANKKPNATAADVAKVSVNVSDPPYKDEKK